MRSVRCLLGIYHAAGGRGSKRITDNAACCLGLPMLAEGVLSRWLMSAVQQQSRARQELRNALATMDLAAARPLFTLLVATPPGPPA